MKRPVTNAIVALCLKEGITYNPDTGVFAYFPERRWPLTTWESRGSLWVSSHLNEYHAASLAWALVKGMVPPADHIVRPIDGDLHNLRLANLACVPVAEISARSERTATGYRNVSVVKGLFRAKVKKDGRYHIKDFKRVEDAVAFVAGLKGVRKPYTGRAVVESVKRVDTVRRGKPHAYWRATKELNGDPWTSTFCTREKAEAWKPAIKPPAELPPDFIATMEELFGGKPRQACPAVDRLRSAGFVAGENIVEVEGIDITDYGEFKTAPRG